MATSNMIVAFIVLLVNWSHVDAAWQQFSGSGDWFYVGYQPADIVYGWQEARHWCMQQGGDLATIDTEALNEFIKTSMEGAYTQQFWIGFSDLDRTGTYGWVDGSSSQYNKWAPEYPKDDDIGKLCAYMSINYGTTTGEWQNDNCGIKKGLVCKRNNGVTTPKTTLPTQQVPGFCPQGYVEAGNKCFKMVKFEDPSKDGKTYDEALALCRSEYGLNPDLASIHNQAESNAIMQQFGDYRHSVYIGLGRDNSYYEDWYWTDNSPVDFTNWGPGEPGYDMCTEIWNIRIAPGTWNDISCSSMRGYVCQTYKDPTGPIMSSPVTSPHTCQTGYMPYGDGCYKTSSDAKTWAEADEACRQQGAQLASIHSESENAFMFSVVTSTQEQSVWIGLNDLEVEGMYYWSDGWHVTYTKWGDGQPSKPENGGCVAYDTVVGWQDAICNLNKNYICKTTAAPPITTPPPMAGTCPSSSDPLLQWVAYGSHCYLFIDSASSLARQTHDNAERTCQSLGGYRSHLASIHDELENHFVADGVKLKSSTYTEAYWIGFIKTTPTAGYRWRDGSPVQYDNWASGEPNGNGLCTRVYLNSQLGLWDDVECTVTLPYACKAPKEPIPTTPVLPEDVKGTCASPEWVPFGQECLLFRADEYASWDEAQHLCRMEGGQLASISDQSENWMIHRSLTENTNLPVDRLYWIGLKKADDSSEFKWVDGRSVEFTNWMPNEPSSGQCVQMHGYGYFNTEWQTQDCSQPRGFVCRAWKGGLPGPGHSVGVVVGVTIAVLLVVTVLLAVAVYYFRLSSGASEPAMTGVIRGIENALYDEPRSNARPRP